MVLHIAWIRRMGFVAWNKRLVAIKTMVSQSSRFYKIDQLNEAGPASYLSPCSDPGLSWITNRIGDSTYQSNAVSMISANNQKLKLKNNINKTRVPGPSPDLSLLYTYDCELPTVAPGGNCNIPAFIRCAISMLIFPRSFSKA
ncbi:hypothetical protein GGP41_000968 [Bipolaris sorokiniana]|uniref:Uncharacterized protein n=1 Tax=Cochliobolus sativus TaxID=45130 RepID=A0A8H5ZQ20_COCSA|nr:hypothetical protein GGP41_000968 [Bipolaris sorokiniana]